MHDQAVFSNEGTGGGFAQFRIGIQQFRRKTISLNAIPGPDRPECARSESEVAATQRRLPSVNHPLKMGSEE
jgi:hypothetical protein